MYVTEIFRSIQGESTYAGLPCTFIRLSGCNLRCNWCDTCYAFANGPDMKLEEILHRVRAWPPDLIEITGGEPLLQAETPELCWSLLQSSARVLVETNGSLNIDLLPEGCIRIMDIKCPGSGQADHQDWDNIARLRKQDEVKFVIADASDFIWAEKITRQYRLTARCPVLFAPVYGRMSPKGLAELILQSDLDLRMQLPLHKFIWDPHERNV